MNHVRVEVSWCSCYTLYSLQGIKQEHQQSRVRISNLLLLFLVFLFPLFFCCVFFFCCFTQSFACKKKLKSTYWFLYFLRAARYGGVAAGATTALRYRTSTSTTTTMLTCVSCICVSQYLCSAVSSCSPLLRRISLWRYPQFGHICQLFHFDSKAKQLQKCQKHVLMSPAVPAVPGRQTTISLYAAVG